MGVPVGAFVYQRKNRVREGADICEIKCKKLACDIQSCFASIVPSRSGVMAIEKCQFYQDRYNKCCENARRREAEEEAEMSVK
mmetsp:Transcript_63034/g.199501  ORF Transcript_63034/g.199501 Transcript_63034/m.199501 type:complete len:83 (-) Transcript_63034:62-310(-)